MLWSDLAAQTLPSLGSTGIGGLSLSSSPTAAPPAPGSNLVSGSSSPPAAAAGVQANAQSSSSASAYYYHRTTPSTQQNRLKGLSLEERIAQDEQRILNECLQAASLATQRAADELIAKQVDEAWERERELWISELIGTRTLGGAAASSPLRLQQQQQQATTLLLTGPSPPKFASPEPLIIRPAYRDHISAAASNKQLDRTWISAHLNVVRRMEDPSNNAGVRDAVQAFSQLNNGTGGICAAAYTTAWNWVAKLVVAAVDTTNPTEVAMQQAKATLHFLCLQFRNSVQERTKHSALIQQQAAAAQQQQPSKYSNNAMAETCAHFCRLVLGKDDECCWSVMYYCLRSGDAAAALEVYLTHHAQPALQDAAVVRLLQALANSQPPAGVAGASSGLWALDAPGPARLALPDRQYVSELYRSIQNQQQAAAAGATDVRIHELGVYSVLSGGMVDLPSDGRTAGFASIEDYLMGSLGRALFSTNPLQELRDLATRITSYGTDYFGDGGDSGGWSFAWPLLLTQQYQNALTHLVNASPCGLGQAAHLGLVLATAGVPLTDLAAATTTAKPPDSAQFTASLLSAYGDHLLGEAASTGVGDGSLAALEYVVRIPDKYHAAREVASLIAKTGDNMKLAGPMSEERCMRQEGSAVIDHYFTPSQVSDLLADAARMVLSKATDTSTTGSALMCFMLAGRYADVLEVLNQLLSPPNVQENNRAFWMDQAYQWHQHYLESRRTRVGEVLEQQGKMKLVETNRILLQLNQFFQLAQLKEPNPAAAANTADARAIAETLGLLPASAHDVAEKQTKLQSLDRLIKDAMPAFILASMELLNREHRRLKTQLSPHGPTKGVVRDRLRQIQDMARLLVRFASLIGVSGTESNKLSNLQAMML